jgi:phosphoribosyl-ATP pyrophosphohydrolase
MAPTDLIKALYNIKPENDFYVDPSETSAGKAALSLNANSALNPEVNPYMPWMSTGQVVGLGLGQLLGSALLGHMARNQAVQQNAEMGPLLAKALAVKTPEDVVAIASSKHGAKLGGFALQNYLTNQATVQKEAQDKAELQQKFALEAFKNGVPTPTSKALLGDIDISALRPKQPGAGQDKILEFQLQTARDLAKLGLKTPLFEKYFPEVDVSQVQKATQNPLLKEYAKNFLNKEEQEAYINGKPIEEIIADKEAALAVNPTATQTLTEELPENAKPIVHPLPNRESVSKIVYDDAVKRQKLETDALSRWEANNYASGRIDKTQNYINERTNKVQEEINNRLEKSKENSKELKFFTENLKKTNLTSKEAEDISDQTTFATKAKEIANEIKDLNYAEIKLMTETGISPSDHPGLAGKFNAAKQIYNKPNFGANFSEHEMKLAETIFGENLLSGKEDMLSNLHSLSRSALDKAENRLKTKQQTAPEALSSIQTLRNALNAPLGMSNSQLEAEAARRGFVKNAEGKWVKGQ